MNRKQFVYLTASMCAGCQAPGPSGGSKKTRVVDAGPAVNYLADGVYDTFQSQGFFVVRKGGRLSAIAAICTHRTCKLEAEPDHSFHCPCHGSNFSPEGRVTQGPATRDLPLFPTAEAAGRLLVTVPAWG